MDCHIRMDKGKHQRELTSAGIYYAHLFSITATVNPPAEVVETLEQSACLLLYANTLVGVFRDEVMMEIVGCLYLTLHLRVSIHINLMEVVGHIHRRCTITAQFRGWYALAYLNGYHTTRGDATTLRHHMACAVEIERQKVGTCQLSQMEGSTVETSHMIVGTTAFREYQHIISVGNGTAYLLLQHLDRSVGINEARQAEHGVHYRVAPHLSTHHNDNLRVKRQHVDRVKHGLVVANHHAATAEVLAYIVAHMELDAPDVIDIGTH